MAAVTTNLDRRVLWCRRRFLEFFPDGFCDETYVETERTPKWEAHRAWTAQLAPATIAELLPTRRATDVARRAVRIESRTYLLFSFEKMALRDATADASGARRFAAGLYDWLHGPGSERERFDRWIDVVTALPRRQTRVATWPVVSVFGFIARPRFHMYVKPTVLRAAAEAYGYDLRYASRPSWSTYRSVLGFARTVRRDLADLRPRDMIDIQSFLWVLGSAEYD